jgi:PTH1 family peptidyl-tRNA hydrolase
MIKTASIILAKPQTFMNLSGKAVLQIKKYFPEAQLVVVHDDLDLPLGSIKIMKSISSAGHNGVQNIIDELGSSDFIRIRIGTQNPKTRGLLAAEDYVLQKFTDEEFLVLSESLKKAKDAIECLLSEGLEITQSKYNG